MAKSAYGKAISVAGREMVNAALDPAAGLRAARRTGEYIVLTNRGQMARGVGINGTKHQGYSKMHKAWRENHGLRTDITNLEITSKLKNNLQARNPRAVVRNGVMQTYVDVGVSASQVGKATGIEKGRFGKRGRANRRRFIGLADPGTGLRSQQDRRIKQIHVEELGRSLKQKNIDVVQTSL